MQRRTRHASILPTSAILLMLAIGGASLPAAAQSSAQQNVTVVVVNALPQPPQPVKAVRVSLSYLQSSLQVTDAQQVTNSQGQALLLVSPSVAQRGDLRIEITGSTDLVIYQPADGQLAALPPTVNVALLPKGSPALLGPAQIQAMLHRSLLQVGSLQKQLAAQKQTASAQNQNSDLGASIAAWAQANGFSSSQVDLQVEQWAQKITSQPAEATNDQKALAELALKHYANAAQLFVAASDVDRQTISTGEAQEQSLDAQVQALQAAQQALLDKLRAPVRQLLDHSEQAAGAYQLNGQFHEATQTLESATATADAESKKHPGDKGFQGLWLEALAATSNARWQEGKVAPASQSIALLSQSATDFQNLSVQYLALGDRSSWAWSQDGLGIALMNQAARAGGDKALPLFAQAVDAFQSALQFYTKTNQPSGWASTQNNLGNALDDEANHSSGDKAAALFAQSVAAYRNVLEVNTRAAAPQDWALTESNLGVVLDDEGDQVPSDKAAPLFDQAVQADQAVLEVQNKTNDPINWAMTENNLGIVFMDKGRIAGNDQAGPLFDQAVQAFRNALLVFTKDSLPQYWATDLNNLGFALKDEAARASGDKATALYDQSVQAYQQALQVRTKADLPRDWADTQYNLANAFDSEGESAADDKSGALFQQAVQAYQNSLQVYTKDYPPLFWANAESGLGNTWLDQAARTDTQNQAPLLDLAVQAYQNALQVYTRSNQPAEWAQTQASLAYIDTVRGNDDAAIAIYEAALQAAPDSGLILRRVSDLYHEHSFRFDLALAGDQRRVQLDPSPPNKMDLLEAELTASKFDVCLQQAAGLPDSGLNPSQIVVRNLLDFACQAASGNKPAALAAEKTFAATAATIQKDSWSFPGTLHFLADAPAFTAGRPAWIALFTAVQNADSAAIAAALLQLEPLLEN